MKLEFIGGPRDGDVVEIDGEVANEFSGGWYVFTVDPDVAQRLDVSGYRLYGSYIEPVAARWK